MEYKTSVSYSGDAKKAIEAASLILRANGFKIQNIDNTELTAIGPGMQNNRQNPILGVSTISFKIAENTIYVYADMSALKFMKRLVYLFPSALVIVLGFLLAIIPSFPWFASLIGVAVAMPSFLIAPSIVKRTGKRTLLAVDAILLNMTTNS